jgi:CheY-like chemotaxis protein
MAAVLVVDDNLVNLKLVRVLLVAAGHDVRTAVDAEDALRVLGDFSPRLILMDIQLPGMDGLTLTRQLKADPTYAGVPIVALTAYAMKGDNDKALASGCAGYITKPIDTRAFADTVVAYLGGAAP